jgi:2-polyprenyl-3-methyl-5-hydroxy-6-metoxy-1,4-benzoquinol methylase
MKQTPIHDKFNPDVLALIPGGASRVVEVGCSSGALAKAYLATNPKSEYVGIEIDPAYAEIAKASCTRVVVDNIEHMTDAVFATLFPSTCWVFGDVLEHLYDPWALLLRIRQSLSPDASVVACIPNAQHWSVQARLNCGLFKYEDAGLLDRTHLRWFTKTTIVELFESSGFRIVDGRARIFSEPQREKALVGIRALANATGANADEAAANAIPFQWVVRATPK